MPQALASLMALDLKKLQPLLTEVEAAILLDARGGPRTTTALMSNTGHSLLDIIEATDNLLSRRLLIKTDGNHQLNGGWANTINQLLDESDAHSLGLDKEIQYLRLGRRHASN